MSQPVTPDQIDALLPQTQCGLCGHGGCMPYSIAIAENNAPINLCPPGGVKTLFALGKLLNQDTAHLIAEMEVKQKPPLLALVREAECIGCTKCIQACPVDAIIGAAKQMHTVITDLCTGCELCLPPCPVDCIDLVEVDHTIEPDINRKRYHDRLNRLEAEKNEQPVRQVNNSVDRKAYIQAALLRKKGG